MRPQAYGHKFTAVNSRKGQSREDASVIYELQKRMNVMDQKNIKLSIRVEDLLSENTNLKIQVSDLQEDKATKSKKISKLQDHFNLLTSNYFNLKKKLEEDFGDKYKTCADEYRINLHSQAHPIALPTAQTSRVVNRFEEKPAHAPHVAKIIRDRQAKAAEKGQLLFKRSSEKMHQEINPQSLLRISKP